MRIRRLTPAEASQRTGELCEVLADAVNNGASLGFIAPIAPDVCRRYWDQVIAGVAARERVLIVCEIGDRIEGAVQLELVGSQNGRHRASVTKLMVHSRAQRRGIARWLMAGIDEVARMEDRSLLVLDTRHGDAAQKLAAEQLYETLGWIRVGVIPGYSMGGDGALHATTFFYRVVPPLVTVLP